MAKHKASFRTRQRKWGLWLSRVRRWRAFRVRMMVWHGTMKVIDAVAYRTMMAGRQAFEDACRGKNPQE